MNSTPARPRAFTLIELLVVVAIISLLISILLPSLGKAKKFARAAACSANLHGLGQSMSIYASDWNDAILGGPTTTGAFLYKNGYDPTLIAGDNNGTYSDSNCPNIVRMDDWMSPILSLTNNLTNTAGDVASRTARFLQTTKTKSFICPENFLPTTQYGGTPLNITTSFLMPSYSTAATFYWYPAGYGGGSFSNLETRGSNPGTLSAPTGYAPRVSRVGQAGRKIFMGDSARFANAGVGTSPATTPDVNLTFNFTATSGFNGYSFASGGACFTQDCGWCTDGAKGNAGAGASNPYDPRIYSFRHGGGTIHAPSGAFKGNFLFFDGHAETLDDLAAGDPNFWMPSGTQWTPNGSGASSALKLQNTVKIKYFSDGKTNVATPSIINIQ